MNRLKELRGILRLQQKEFAERIGVNKTTYNNYERGTREPDAKFWISIAHEFDVSTDYLLGLTKDPKIQKSPAVTKVTTGDECLNEIIEIYGLLNEQGKNSLHQQAIMHSDNAAFKKRDSSEKAG